MWERNCEFLQKLAQDWPHTVPSRLREMAASETTDILMDSFVNTSWSHSGSCRNKSQPLWCSLIYSQLTLSTLIHSQIDWEKKLDLLDKNLRYLAGYSYIAITYVNSLDLLTDQCRWILICTRDHFGTLIYSRSLRHPDLLTITSAPWFITRDKASTRWPQILGHFYFTFF